MCSGKGEIQEYVAVVRPGMVLFELGGITQQVAETAFNKAGHKLSVKTTMIEKE